MKRADLFNGLVADGLTEAQAALAIDTIFDKLIPGALARLEPVSIRGFARFEPRRWPERKRKPPRTGEIVVTPPRTYIRFLATDVLKRRINP